MVPMSPLQPQPGPVDWHRLFPDADYRFHMGLRPGDPVRFFRATGHHEALVAERARWLDRAPDDYLALRSDGVELLDEAIELAMGWGSIEPESGSPSGSVRQIEDPLARCDRLGRCWEPDFLLLRSDQDGLMRLVGGVVCFPSGWALSEKVGRSVTAIHGIVPGLNDALDRQIQAFFRRLPPDVAWERDNWGLAASPDLNRHPARQLPPLDAEATLAGTWVRIEHQIFLRLPRTGGVLFGIRVAVHTVADVIARPELARGLRRALETMPAEVAAYKGLSMALPTLIGQLRAVPDPV
jgi:dimethylamine monooxygenase subunit A